MKTRFVCSLHSHFDKYGKAAARCDLAGLETLLPSIPDYVRDVLQKTQAFVRSGKPEAYFSLRDCYQRSEVMRKTSSRARLANTIRAAQRRSEWDPGRHNTDAAALSLVYRPRNAERPEWPIMSNASWPKFSFTEVLKPPDGWRTDHAILSTYSADLLVIVTSLLALGGCDLDGDRTGSRVELVRAIEALRGRVRILAQEGRVPIPSKQLPILKLLDKFLSTIVTRRDRKLFPCESSAVAFS